MIFRLRIDAFVLSENFREAVRQASENPSLARSTVTSHEGGLVGAITYYASNPTPELLLVEEDSDDETMMGHLAQLAGVCDPGTQVVVVGQLNDISLYRTLKAQGISEYIVTPTTGRSIVDTVSMVYAEPSAKPKGKTIGVFANKGGSGSSTVAMNTAWSLAKAYGESVILVDLDLAFGTVSLSLNIGVEQTIGEALLRPDRLDMKLFEQGLAPAGDNLSILAAPNDLSTTPTITIDAVEAVVDLATQLAAFVVLDIPHAWQDWTRQLMVTSDELLLVSSPDLASLRDCKNIVEQINPARGDETPLRLVLNRCNAYAKGELAPKDFKDTVGLSPLAALPHDPSLFLRSLNNGEPMAEVSGGEKVAEIFREIAVAAAGRKPAHGGEEKASMDILSSLQGLFKKGE